MAFRNGMDKQVVKRSRIVTGIVKVEECWQKYWCFDSFFVPLFTCECLYSVFLDLIFDAFMARFELEY